MLAATLVCLAAMVCVACLPLADASSSLNGGTGCRFYNYRQVNDLLRAAGETNATAIDEVITRMSYVNFYLCKACVSKQGTEMQFMSAVVEGRGECWCRPGFGYSTKTSPSGYVQRYFGCTACPDGTTTSPTRGPYSPTRRTWSDTACA